MFSLILWANIGLIPGWLIIWNFEEAFLEYLEYRKKQFLVESVVELLVDFVAEILLIFPKKKIVWTICIFFLINFLEDFLTTQNKF